MKHMPKIYVRGQSHASTLPENQSTLTRYIQILLTLYRQTRPYFKDPQDIEADKQRKLELILTTSRSQGAEKIFYRHLKRAYEEKLMKETLQKLQDQAATKSIMSRRQEINLIAETVTVLNLLRSEFEASWEGLCSEDTQFLLNIIGDLLRKIPNIEFRQRSKTEDKENKDQKYIYKAYYPEEPQPVQNPNQVYSKTHSRAQSSSKNPTTRAPSANISIDRRKTNNERRMPLDNNLVLTQFPSENKIRQMGENEFKKSSQKPMRAQTAIPTKKIKSRASSRMLPKKEQKLIRQSQFQNKLSIGGGIRKSQQQLQRNSGSKQQESPPNITNVSIIDEPYRQGGLLSVEAIQSPKGSPVMSKRVSKLREVNESEEQGIKIQIDRKRMHRMGTKNDRTGIRSSIKEYSKSSSLKKRSNISGLQEQFQKLRYQSHEQFEKPKPAQGRRMSNRPMTKRSLLGNRSSAQNVESKEKNTPNNEANLRDQEAKNSLKDFLMFKSPLSEEQRLQKEIFERSMRGLKKTALIKKHSDGSESELSEAENREMGDYVTVVKENQVSYKQLADLRSCFLQARTQDFKVGSGQEENSVFFIDQGFIGQRENTYFQEFLRDQRDDNLLLNTEPFNIEHTVTQRGSTKICELERIYTFETEGEWLKNHYSTLGHANYLCGEKRSFHQVLIDRERKRGSDFDAVI